MDTSTSIPMSVAAAAAHAKVSSKTIRRWLTSGRLQASRGADGAWLIDVDDLDHAIATPGPSVDSPALATRHGQDMSIVQDLLGRLERQAEQIGRLDAELMSGRRELDEARQQLLALQAPADILTADERQELEVLRAEHQVNLHRMGPPSALRTPWWRRFLGAPAS